MTQKGGEIKTLPTKVVKPEAKQKLDDANKAAATQKVIVNRVLKYKYPRDCKDTLSRKAFRQKVRNKLRKIEREIAKTKGEERRVLKGELEAYQAEVIA